MMTIIDEFSTFPLAIPGKDTYTSTAIKCLEEIKTYGTPGNIHSDKGSAFVSKSRKHYLNTMGINSSKTTPYHP